MASSIFTRSVQDAPIGSLFVEFAKNGASQAMNVNGTLGTPVVFTFHADATMDLSISEMRFAAIDNGISSGEKFLAIAGLTNGILVEVKSENSVFMFPPIKQTSHFKDYFNLGSGLWDLLVGSGQDSLTASFLPDAHFRIRKQGTFGIGNDDYVKIFIRDSISTVTSLEFIVIGSKQ